MPSSPRGRRRTEAPPEHRPKKYLKHVADEYDDLGNVQVAAELRRHLRGHYDRWYTLAGGSKGRDNGHGGDQGGNAE